MSDRWGSFGAGCGWRKIRFKHCPGLAGNLIAQTLVKNLWDLDDDCTPPQ